MRAGRPSWEQLRENFDSMLASVLAGGGVRSCNGLDSDTDDALWAIMMAYPDVTPELVEAAHRAFAGYQDGSNAARWEAEMDRWLEEREQRRQARQE
ncbi:hypothetical protein [Kitasatospora acidiphila]|uniref:hypothetical protein n=1 Tax=Kitasatospora acidiphila TaxID=2567942 RepID=UPI0015F0017E|nr:hypothetical protein [Kitasatospora acidiphila]